MKLRIPLLLLLSLGSVRAQQPAVVLPEGWSGERIDIREVRIDGVRPLKEIGIRRTQIDTLVLRENIALSMADVLTFSSPLFVKSHGRATLSTVSFRGTSPSHTQVTWNGMRINSPMLGMTDFSLIPAYFIDRATLLHGTSSVTDTGGGLGGAIRLRTATNDRRGFGVQYVQGIGSFRTFDEFARFTYGDERWQVSTRAVLSSSPNDYPYVNRDRKENIYDDEHRIVGQYYPRERNRSGAYRDLHVLQEVGYRTRGGDRLSLSAWWLDSDRELAALTTEYSDPTDFENRQRERTLRGVLAWEHTRERWKVAARAGYVHSRLRYDYSADKGNGTLEPMIRSRSRTETFYGEVEGEYAPSRAWLLTGSVALHQHRVHSADRTILTQSGEAARVEYDERRAELSAALTARWRPTDRLGLSLVLREELFGTERSPLIPAFFADYVLSKRGQLRRRPPCRAITASRRSTTSISSRAAIPTCAARAVSPTKGASRSAAGATSAGRFRDRPHGSTSISTTGFCGCRRPKGSSPRATSGRCTPMGSRCRRRSTAGWAAPGVWASTAASRGPVRSTKATR